MKSKFVPYILAALLGAAFVIVPGCSLMPKRVEFFQKKVQAVPEVTDKTRETQRQAADYVSTKLDETKRNALLEESPPSVLHPLDEASAVADGLTVSLGPPADPWKKEAEILALRLKTQRADYEAAIDHYRKKVEPLEGKKIEGTGKISLPYFAYLGIIIGLALLVWAGLKIYGMINPAVGAGLTGLSSVGRVGTKLLSRGFSEVVEAGESFKDKLKAKADANNDGKIAIAEVLEIFKHSHQAAQSRDTQDLVQNLTRA